MLGTAQLGMNYGIANRAGRPDPARADALLARAWREGVAALDTARAYGDSEHVVGAFLAAHPECRFGVVTKLSPEDADEPDRAVAESIERLQGRVMAVLLHDAAMLERWDGVLGATLRRAVADGRITAAGASVYTPSEFARALDVDGIDIIQAPFNIFDRGLLDEGLFDRAARRGKRVHLRSVFLQGMLLMDEPPAFAAIAVKRWHALCERHGRTPREVALLFAAQTTDATLVIGCDSEEQLAANMNALRGSPLSRACIDEIRALPPQDERLIRPYLWN